MKKYLSFLAAFAVGLLSFTGCEELGEKKHGESKNAPHEASKGEKPSSTGKMAPEGTKEVQEGVKK